MRQAVTAILVCGDQIYLTRRQNHLASFPGFSVFPGGTVDTDDVRPANGSTLLDAHEPRLMAALLRELNEEIGFDLERAAQAGRVLSIETFGRVETPPTAPRRFDTHFYRVNLAERPLFVMQDAEIAEGEWASVDDWLARYADGRLLLAFPTRAVLTTLGTEFHCTSIDFPALRGTASEPLFGLRMYDVGSNTLPPAMHTNCFLIGDADARRVLVDPSPKSDQERLHLLQRADHVGFQEIFLTHHHVDHYERADHIARERGLPIGASADTQARIRARTPRFFDGLTVKTYAEGDLLTRWLGRDVRVLEVPGHDEGQLALMPEDRAWCIVGDLIQGIGTVVISKPEGNMRKYFASLQRIIDLAPAVIVPSHGGALGGVHYLQTTLKHRRAREAMVRQLHDGGHSIEEMLAMIYVGLDAALKPLARRNIESHLDKLREEGIVS